MQLFQEKSQKIHKKISQVWVPYRNTIYNTVNEIRATAVLTDMKPKHERWVVTEEKLNKIATRLEQLLHLSHALQKKKGTVKTNTKLLTTTALQRQLCIHCSHMT
jgi:phosphoenolpyruvate carboxylase